MLKGLFLFVGVAALGAAFVCAQESKMTIPVASTPADDGKQMFVNYCAPCHGLDGRGHGPTASALKVMPADLSMLSKNNKGVYPDTHVVAVLRFGTENPAHGSKAMPVWGPALGRMSHPTGALGEQSLRIANLVQYVSTLQVK